jgi:hypothetical protein
MLMARSHGNMREIVLIRFSHFVVTEEFFAVGEQGCAEFKANFPVYAIHKVRALVCVNHESS